MKLKQLLIESQQDNEEINVLFDAIIGDLGSKAEKITNDYIEAEFINSPDYKPDEPNTYYLEVMENSQIKDLYQQIKKYIR